MTAVPVLYRHVWHLACCVLLCGALVWSPAGAAAECIETPRLNVCDLTQGALSQERFAALAQGTAAALQQVIDFWSADDGTARFGKIRVEFAPPRRGYYATEFHMQRSPAGRLRVIRVWGAVQAPQELVHKLTVAIFPTADKLVRNMMGGAMEATLGNRQSFPGCGYAAASWVLALRDAGAYVPLHELGSGHEAWGMAVGSQGWLYPTDRRRQHATYAEAVAFGEFLLDSHGKEALARFYQLAQRRGERPWQEVYGQPLAALEQRWLARMEEERATRAAELRAVSALWSADADTCPAQRPGD